MTAYYNEIDPFTAQWLRNLIAQNLIAPGDVDERSIVDVQPDDLLGYEQCHFFAGIGGWSYALRLAGWPDDKPVWTGSCPCQPFSAAGERRGFDDERHLWPQFERLIAQCSPSICFGEQVAAKAGREWLSRVRADLETLGYAVGCSDLCAAGVSAPHMRQRLYWCADSEGERFDRSQDTSESTRRNSAEDFRSFSGSPNSVDGIDPTSRAQCAFGHMEKRPWETYEGIDLGDGRKLRNKPGLSLLAHGISGRVGLLRAYGNAIVPQVAAEFIQAYRECRP